MILLPFGGALFLLTPIDNAIFIVHHSDYLVLIGCIHGSNRYVSHRSKLTAVIEMFVLKAKEVPYKTSAKCNTLM
jgi:hypothetical protein